MMFHLFHLQDSFDPRHVNLSIEEAVMAARMWLPLMAQTLTREDQLGVSLLSKEMLSSKKDIMSKFRHVVSEID